jgi:hypothetical protein
MIAKLASLAKVALLGIAACGCHHGPIPSERDMACESTCQSVACINPDLDADAIAECESYCRGKFDASSEQGAACEEAFTDAMNCLGELTCDEYTEWLTHVGDSCPIGRSQVASTCDGIYLEPYILPP